MTYPPTLPPGLPNALGDIIAKIRRITKSPSQNQITDNQIIQYINTYFLYDFPEEIRIKNTLSNWNFATVPYQETYPLPTDTFISVFPPFYVDGYESYFTQSQQNFYRLYPRLGLQNSGPGGNGTPGPYSFQLTNFPVLQNNVVIGVTDVTGFQAVATDTPINTFTGSLAGPGIAPNPPFPTPPTSFINYVTGQITILYVNDIPGNNIIEAQIVPYNPSRPVACLFYYDTIYLRPIPDSSYLVNIAAYINPLANILGGGSEAPGVGFVNATDTPQIKAWWQLLAWGASMKIFEDRGDLENINRFYPLYDQQKRLVLRRTLVEMANEKVATIYTEQSNYQVGNFFNQF